MVDKCPDCGSNMNRSLEDLGQAFQYAVKCTRCSYHKLVPQYEKDLKQKMISESWKSLGLTQ